MYALSPFEVLGYICDTRFDFWESCEKAKSSPNEGHDIYGFPAVKVWREDMRLS